MVVWFEDLFRACLLRERSGREGRSMEISAELVVVYVSSPHTGKHAFFRN